MTKQVKYPVKCLKCEGAAVCSVCGSMILNGTPFSHWIRNLPYPLNSQNYDNQNLDFVWFHYRPPGWIITIEEKRYAGRSTVAQGDTHGIISQMLAYASGQSFQTYRGKRPIEYRGHYVICFERTNPKDSEWISINGILATVEDLERLLQDGTINLREKVEYGQVRAGT